MIRVFSALLLAGLLSFAAPSRAFTPESGWWWNPDEPGYGFSIEIQDNFIFMVAFAYDADGAPTWYAAEGLMANSGLFTAPLYHREDGPCVGCPYQTPGPTFAVGATIRVDFTSQTTARLTWGGRQIDVERHDFYLSRNPGIDPKTELWLGEWNAVIDIYNYGGEAADFPFLGEVLVFDQIIQGTSVDMFDGCRPEDSLVGECDQFALDNHEAFGQWLCDGCGANGGDVNLVWIQDGFIDGIEHYFLYEVETGTSQFRGYGKLCTRGHALSSNPIGQCLDNDATYPVLPVRGWRSASRAFIQGDDNAPSMRPPDARSKRGTLSSLLTRLNIPAKRSADSPQTSIPVARAERTDTLRARAAAAAAHIRSRQEAGAH